jgi:hypothetical protein
MSHHTILVLALGLGLGQGSALPAPKPGQQARAIALIEEAKGGVVIDETRPGKPVIRVYLSGTPWACERWAHLLKVFPELEDFEAC